MDRDNFGLSPQDQLKILIYLLKIAALLSLAGSFAIIYNVLKDKDKRGSGYHRLCLGMSFSDLMVSFWIFVASWAIPAEDKYSYMNHGNRQTCSAQGFFVQLGITTPLYNLSLCIHLMVSVCYSWGRQKRNLLKVETMLHVLPWAVGIGTSSAGLAMELFNNLHTLCWINEYPSYCSRSPHVDCARAEKANLYRLAFYFVPLCVWFIVCFAALFRVFRYVYSQEKKMDNKVLRRSSGTFERRKSDTSSGFPKPIQRRASGFSMNLGHSKVLAWSIFSYALAFFATWFPMIIEIIQAYVRGRATFLTRAARNFFWPLQGFFNFLVYFKIVERFGIGSFMLSCFRKCCVKAGGVSRRESTFSLHTSVLVAIQDINDGDDVSENDMVSSALDENGNSSTSDLSIYKMNVLSENEGTQKAKPVHLASNRLDFDTLSDAGEDNDENVDTDDCITEVLKISGLVKANTQSVNDEINVDAEQHQELCSTAPEESYDVCCKKTSSIDAVHQNEVIQELEIATEGDRGNNLSERLDARVLDNGVYDYVEQQKKIEDVLDKELAKFRNMIKTSASNESCVLDDQ